MKIKALLVILFICTVIIMQSTSQSDMTSFMTENDSALLMQKLQKTLKGAQTFNSVINGLEIVGYPMFLIGCLSPKSLWENPWIISSFVGAGLSFSLAILTTVEISLARKTLGRHCGDLGLNMTKSGLGIVYRIPGR